MTRAILTGLLFSAAVISFGAGAEAQHGGLINGNQPVAGVFTPSLPLDGAGKPYVDYQFFVNAHGTYQIDLVSSDPHVFDPYLSLIHDGGQVASDDDGGSGYNARILRQLSPGLYIIRVTRFGAGAISVPVSFTLSITAALSPVPPVVISPSPAPYTPSPPLGQPLNDALARVLITRYYTTQGQFAGQYTMTISQTRLVHTGPTSAQVHARYNYTCIRARCSGAPSGVDQRVFFLQRVGAQWQVVRMGAHLSGSL